MPSFDEILSNMPLHRNFYLRGVVNSLLPQFMNPMDSMITEKNISGEAIEMLRFLAERSAPDLQEGEIRSVDYKAIEDAFPEKDNSFYQVRNSLGQFGVTKQDGKYVIFDTYDFEVLPDTSFISSAQASVQSGNPYPFARHVGQMLMPENPDGSSDDDALRVRITIPEQTEVIPTDYDNDPQSDTFVFRGAMTTKRKQMFDNFMSGVMSNAQNTSMD